MDLHWKCLCGMTVVEFVRQKEGPSYMRVFLGPKQTELKKMTCTRSGSQIQECLTDSHSGECKAWWKNMCVGTNYQIGETCKCRFHALWPTRRLGPRRPTMYNELVQIKDSSSKKRADPGPRAITIVEYAKEYGESRCKSSCSEVLSAKKALTGRCETQPREPESWIIWGQPWCSRPGYFTECSKARIAARQSGRPETWDWEEIWWSSSNLRSNSSITRTDFPIFSSSMGDVLNVLIFGTKSEPAETGECWTSESMCEYQQDLEGKFGCEQPRGTSSWKEARLQNWCFNFSSHSHSWYALINAFSTKSMPAISQCGMAPFFLAKDGAMALGWQCGTERKPQHFVVHDRQGSRSKESNTMLLRAN